jgi:hypothetical protein
VLRATETDLGVTPDSIIDVLAGVGHDVDTARTKAFEGRRPGGTAGATAETLKIHELGQGQALIRMGEAPYGAELLDEVMVEVEGDRVSALTAGIVYCAVILACQQIFDLPRAQAWTRVLGRWCDEQPDLVRFRGTCLVHRSQLAALRGDWETAIAEEDGGSPPSQRVHEARPAEPVGRDGVGLRARPVVGGGPLPARRLHRMVYGSGTRGCVVRPMRAPTGRS